jgi:hypothetical protein
MGDGLDFWQSNGRRGNAAYTFYLEASSLSRLIAVRCGSSGVVKLLRLQALDQFKGMDRFRDQFKLEALPMTSQQYV